MQIKPKINWEFDLASLMRRVAECGFSTEKLLLRARGSFIHAPAKDGTSHFVIQNWQRGYKASAAAGVLLPPEGESITIEGHINAGDVNSSLIIDQVISP